MAEGITHGTAYNQIQISEAGGQKNIGGYAEYIATREGVEKIDESRKFAPATNKQKQLIKKILSDFPDSRSSLEYEDYLKDKTIGTASEFITRALEENVDEMMHTTTYADYIATVPVWNASALTDSLPMTVWRWICKRYPMNSMRIREMCGRQSYLCAVRMPNDSAMITAADGGICSGRKRRHCRKI